MSQPLTFATVSAPAYRHLRSDIDDPIWFPVRDEIARFIEANDVKRHVSFLAPGFDQMAASVAHWMGIEVEVVRPFPDHADRWPPKERENTELLMRLADEVITIHPTRQPTSVDRAYKRIVQDADILLAIETGRSVVVERAIARAKEKSIPIRVSSGLDIMEGKFYPLR